MRHMRLSGRAGAAQAEVDMTPMLDIVFIMLIFFIVATSFVKESAVDINPLSKSSDPKPAVPVLTVELDHLGGVTIDDRKVPLASVAANVEAWRLDVVDPSVVIKTAPDAPTWALVRVVDEVKLASIDKVSVAPWIE